MERLYPRTGIWDVGLKSSKSGTAGCTSAPWERVNVDGCFDQSNAKHKTRPSMIEIIRLLPTVPPRRTINARLVAVLHSVSSRTRWESYFTALLFHGSEASNVLARSPKCTSFRPLNRGTVTKRDSIGKSSARTVWVY